jgi:hypothetical protein
MPNLWRGESRAEIAAELESSCPTLRLGVGERGRVISGVFNVEHDGTFLAGFQIEIWLDRTDILGLPTVNEVGGRIPRVAERHINLLDGSACLYLPEDLVVRCQAPLGIRAFLDGPVRSYFLGQAGVELGVPFPLGEWGHGTNGLREMLHGLLGFQDIEICMRFLELLSNKVVKVHWACPCRSGRELRACHLGLVRGLRSRMVLGTRRFLLERARQALSSEG